MKCKLPTACLASTNCFSSVCNLSLNIDNVSLEDSVKLIIPAYRYSAIALWEYATCDSALKWFYKLLERLQSFNLETRATLLMAAASMLRNLIEVRVPFEEHFTWTSRLTTWIDPLASIFKMDIDCCEYHFWIRLEEKIYGELGKCCITYSQSHTKLVGIVCQFLLREPLRQKSSRVQS